MKNNELKIVTYPNSKMGNGSNSISPDDKCIINGDIERHFKKLSKAPRFNEVADDDQNIHFHFDKENKEIVVDKKIKNDRIKKALIVFLGDEDDTEYRVKLGFGDTVEVYYVQDGKPFSHVCYNF